jgi:outer membrane lipoprotein-sorting protein
MMKKIGILFATLALLMAGCGDKDAGQSMDEAVDATKEMASDTADTVSDAAGDAYDATKKGVHDTAQAVADATDETPEEKAEDAINQ